LPLDSQRRLRSPSLAAEVRAGRIGLHILSPHQEIHQHRMQEVKVHCVLTQHVLLHKEPRKTSVDGASNP
jgi:hypothetical protein